MKSAVKLKGIYPPIPTPFVNGRVSTQKLADNVSRWSRTAISGFVVLGSNGEYPYLSEKEKVQVVETVAASASPDMTIIAGTGCESTAETLRLTAACADAGAHAALVVSPHYYGGRMTTETLVNHYATVAGQSPVPIVLYSVPKFTHINIGVEAVAQLCRHPNIVGIKDSAGAVNQLGEHLNAARGHDFSVLVGTAGAFLGALGLGCPGGVLALANVAPGQCVEIKRLHDEGNLAEARDLQLKMIPLNKAITATYGVPGLKAALDLLGYFGGDPRLPLMPVGSQQRLEIKAILNNSGLL